jgi:nucleoside-diphosphate-sugar epimerase
VGNVDNRLNDDLDHILRHTDGLWEMLRGKRIFLTGGTGFFGTWLLESFAWANDRLHLGAEAVVLTRNRERFAARSPHLAGNSSIRFVDGDTRDFVSPKGPFHWLIHAAAQASVDLNANDPLLMADTIVKGTRRVLDFAAEHHVERALFVSSGAVYGKQPPDVTHVPETQMTGPDPLDPRSAYAEAKRLAEFLCSIVGRQQHIEIPVARCYAFVGPFFPLDQHFAVGNFIRDGLRRGPIVIAGDGTPFRSYLYAADLVIWLWTILAKGRGGVAYNVGSDQAITIRDLAAQVAGLIDPRIEIRINGRPDATAPPERYVPSIDRAKQELGLRVWNDLDSSLAKTIRWYRSAVQQ